MEATISKFKFEGYKVLSSSIKIDEKYNNQELKIGFIVSGKIFNKEDKFQLFLKANVQNDFVNIIVDAIGNFTFVTDEPIRDKEQISELFYVNSSAILFPYIRAYITTLSALSDNHTIVIPTLNLTALGEELLRNIEIID